MSANPTQVDWGAPPVPLQEGNRALEAIARQEPLGALLAFSGLHEQIRNRRLATGGAADRDWSETERFILDEVLQLICDRAQTLSLADGIVVALTEEKKTEDSKVEDSKVEDAKIDEFQIKESKPETSCARSPELVFRATSGPLTIERGVHLLGDSAFLKECLESGRILRCDDCDRDPRIALDFARQLGVRSTVLVPLRGRREQLGVLQAFSTTARAFTDDDVRCFDLFAELVLSALKPVDQDRRINWLSDVAEEVLRPERAAAAAPAAEVPAIEVPAIKTQPVEPIKTSVETGLAPPPIPAAAAFPAARTTPDAELPAQDQTVPPQPAAVVTAPLELPEPFAADETVATDQTFEAAETWLAPCPVPWSLTAPAPPPPLPFLHRLSLAGSSRPGLSVVLGLVVVAALFSAGAWWGMQVHGKTSVASSEATVVAATRIATRTAPAPPSDVLTPAVSDNLMNPSQGGSESPLTAVAEGKLAALPKVTGVRHWSSSTGSTVVIDMEDQVPYEVHRLMSPERIYFDLHDTVLSRDLDGKTMDVGDASLTRVRVAQPVAGVTRVVLDTRDGSNFSVSMESSPYRLVVELRGSETTLAAKALAAKPLAPDHAPANLTAVSRTATAPAPLKTAPEAALTATPVSGQPAPARTGKFRIVLDAGHGGWDLGTVGRQGLLEKDLVLDVTQRLGKLLQARLGAEVMFTRSDDTYLPLDQRADFANHTQADLFVSVHANYSSSAAARGVETYYTNLFSAPGSKEVEKHDDGTLAKLTPVSLSTGGLHDKTEESRRLASSVQHALYATLAASSPDIRNRGIKDSAFAVLTGATMPAILTEISFVSSPADEQKLQSATYRQQIAEALYKGIAGYEQSSPKAKIAQLQKPNAR